MRAPEEGEFLWAEQALADIAHVHQQAHIREKGITAQSRRLRSGVSVNFFQFTKYHLQFLTIHRVVCGFRTGIDGIQPENRSSEAPSAEGCPVTG